ncbi:MAG: hypothetical protein NT013_01305 [Planctomycetia bacterium]|nr:hypothetical protein [Planctomycetia bacterium]
MEDKVHNWANVIDKPGWQPRDTQGEFVYKDQLWLFGGWFDSFQARPRDVWSSAYGKTWTRATDNAGWFPRAYHQASVLNCKIYVFGGGNYVPKYHAVNDVWCSEAGEHWTQLTKHAPWSLRLWFSLVVYRDHIFVLGGWLNNPSKNWSDVWYSKDGKEWKQLKSEAIRKERHEQSATSSKTNSGSPAATLNPSAAKSGHWNCLAIGRGKSRDHMCLPQLGLGHGTHGGAVRPATHSCSSSFPLPSVFSFYLSPLRVQSLPQ